jgi:alkyl hydroperoxide reductase subunit AhpF
MNNYSRERFDVLVVGGGPAGMAAAVCAAETGARAGLVDENAALGGQIWRGELAGDEDST